MELANLDRILKDRTGLPLKEIYLDGNNETQRRPLTLRCALTTALDHPEQGAESKEKFRRHRLACKIEDANGSVDLKIEEVAKLKKLTGKFLPTITQGRVWDIFEIEIENKPNESKTKNSNS